MIQPNICRLNIRRDPVWALIYNGDGTHLDIVLVSVETQYEMHGLDCPSLVAISLVSHYYNNRDDNHLSHLHTCEKIRGNMPGAEPHRLLHEIG